MENICFNIQFFLQLSTVLISFLELLFLSFIFLVSNDLLITEEMIFNFLKKKWFNQVGSPLE